MILVLLLTLVMKDSYISDFMEYRKDLIKTEIEKELLKNTTKLLLQLGVGFEKILPY